MKAGETLESKVFVFQVQMVAYFRQKRYFDTLISQVPIRVIVEPEDDLRSQVGHDAIHKARRAWTMIMNEIIVPQIVEHIAMFGCPREA